MRFALTYMSAALLLISLSVCGLACSKKVSAALPALDKSVEPLPETITEDSTILPPNWNAYPVLFTVMPPIIDGRQDDLWKESPLLLLEKNQDISTISFLFDDDNLYLFAVLTDRDLRAFMRTRDEEQGDDDALVLEIDADGTGERTYRMAINLHGDLRDYYTAETSRNSSLQWNAQAEIFTRQEGTVDTSEGRDISWTLELSVPLTSFLDAPNLPPMDGDTWLITICQADNLTPGKPVCWPEEDKGELAFSREIEQAED